MTSETVLRPAVVGDVGAVLDLWSVAAENDSRPLDRAVDVERLIARDPAALVLAERGGVVVGSLVSGWDGWRAHVYRLAVHPTARRTGVARELLEHAEDRLVALGAARIDAMVLGGNELGQSLWRAAGYVQQDDWRRWVKPVG